MEAIVDWDRDTPQWLEICAIAGNYGEKRSFSGNSLASVYEPLVSSLAGDQSFVIGQIGQSLDGRIATPTGHSHYINGAAALVHLHRLRALVDAVVVGVGTVIADDPQLTVRRAAFRPGRVQPARVILDPRGRVPATAKCFASDGARRIVMGARADIAEVEHIALPASDVGFVPDDVIKALRAVGLKRILIEGGAVTLSRFLAAGRLDRLHVMTAPLIIGSGPAGLQLPPIEKLDQALRPRITHHALPGGDILFDCTFPREEPA